MSDLTVTTKSIDEAIRANRAMIVAWFDHRYPSGRHIPHPDRRKEPPHED